MKFIISLLLTAILGMSVGSSQTAGGATNGPAVSVFAPIEFLVGGTWRGDLPSATNQMKLGIESKYEWTGNHQGIRFESAWVTGDKRRPYCSGLYLWNPEKKQLEIVYTDSQGALVEGSVELVGDVRQHDLKVVDKTGKAEQLQARMTHPDEVTYVNEIFMMEAGAWQKLIAVSYHRSS